MPEVCGDCMTELRSRATERELVVVTPTMFLRVHTWLHFTAAVCSRATCADHPEACVLQGVESLLYERVFEEEAGRVAVRRAAVWVAVVPRSGSRSCRGLGRGSRSTCLRTPHDTLTLAR